MKRFALFLAAIMIAASAGVAGASLSIFTGPGGTNPAFRPDLIPDLNTLINTLNTHLFNFMDVQVSSSEAGEVYMQNALSWAPHASCTTAAKECVVFVDEKGNVVYVPAY